jgi:hypothetical protein
MITKINPSRNVTLDTVDLNDFFLPINTQCLSYYQYNKTRKDTFSLGDNDR